LFDHFLFSKKKSSRGAFYNTTKNKLTSITMGGGIMSKPASECATLSPPNIRRKVLVDFGLFFIFFLFYIGAAVVQTPLGKKIATIQTLGMPFGLLISLAVFPVSWIIICIWFYKAR
jgi:hypothetical protein